MDEQAMILVTGASGFIGKRVCDALAAHQRKFVAVDRSLVDGLPGEVVQGDLTKRDFLCALFQSYSFDCVVHLAGLLNTYSRKWPQEAMRVNVGASLELLRLAAEHKVTRFIYGSSVSVYGTKSRQSCGEVTEFEPASPEDVYGVCKRYVEVVGEGHGDRQELEFAAVRIASVVGAGSASATSKWRSGIFEALGADRPAEIQIPYRASELVPLIHVDEVANIISILAAADRLAHSVYNTPAETWSFADLQALLASLRPDLKVTLGSQTVFGIPQAVDGTRLMAEFGYRPCPLKERFIGAVERGRKRREG